MKKWSVVAVLALAQFVMVLDSTVMNVSISTIVKDLNTTVSALQACITFYTLTMAALMLIGAKLAEKLGLRKAFIIGGIVYGIGSFITGISPGIVSLFLGWSIIEGLGAVLVIPAIAALVAVNYSGKDRVTAFAIIGGVSGAAAAAGPLIGGFMTTYLSWRYVFIAETIIMAFVLLMSRKFKVEAPKANVKIDIPSAILSALGMTLLVFGMLQSKTWGWILPMSKPTINGHEIAPLGISLVAYLILSGAIILKLFLDRQSDLEERKQSPLLKVSMLAIKQLRSGLAVLLSQYMITSAVFFVVPIYLQMVIGLNALDTGIKILPLSLGLIVFSIIGTKMAANNSPKRIVRVGQFLLVFGSIALLFSIKPELTGSAFAVSMFAVGSGLGLLASQLGNINMSAVSKDDTSQVGGLQGTFQNLGASLGTALIGSVMIISLTNVFTSSINQSSLPASAKTSITQKTATGVPIIPANSLQSEALASGASQSEANTLSDTYKQSQLTSLKRSIMILIVIASLSFFLSRNIPQAVPKY